MRFAVAALHGCAPKTNPPPHKRCTHAHVACARTRKCLETHLHKQPHRCDRHCTRPCFVSVRFQSCAGVTSRLACALHIAPHAPQRRPNLQPAFRGAEWLSGTPQISKSPSCKFTTVARLPSPMICAASPRHHSFADCYLQAREKPTKKQAAPAKWRLAAAGDAAAQASQAVTPQTGRPHVFSVLCPGLRASDEAALQALGGRRSSSSQRTAASQPAAAAGRCAAVPAQCGVHVERPGRALQLQRRAAAAAASGRAAAPAVSQC